MIDFIIVDDNKYILNEISNMIDSIMNKKLYKYNKYTFEEYDKKFKKVIDNNQNDKIFILDIETPHNNGLDVSIEINNKYPEGKIIFISDYQKEYESRIIAHIDTILGFISKDDKTKKSKLSKYINLAIKDFKKGNFVIFKDGINIIKVNIDDITYVETNNRETAIHFEKRKTIYTKLTLKTFEIKLPENFIKSHRACIINIDKVLSLNKRKKTIVFFNENYTNLVSRKYIKGIEENLSKSIY